MNANYRYIFTGHHAKYNKTIGYLPAYYPTGIKLVGKCTQECCGLFRARALEKF